MTPNTALLQELNGHLETVVDIGASDLHLSSDCVPLARLHGGLLRLADRTLSAEDVAAFARALLEEKDWNTLAERKNIDFAYETLIRARPHRFRCNVYVQALGLSIVMRMIPTEIQTPEECGLPPSVVDMTNHANGLVLITGSSGSGKTTTLAALLDHINRTRRVHIITIEDPIEYVHVPAMALIHQRQVGVDIDSFQSALRGALREDPDVIMVGEMRDLATTQLAITAAETGHLVLSTMHTNSAAKTIDRLIDAFPVDQQPQIRLMLSESLRGIVAQMLVPRVDSGRVLACEVLHSVPAIATMIRDRRSFQITSVLQTSRPLGMCSMDDALCDLFQKGIISAYDARSRILDPTLFERLQREAAEQARQKAGVEQFRL